jgi:hypothetical protein
LLVLAGSPPRDGARARASVATPYQNGLWLAGDHHIHTKYSSDGNYEILAQVKAAAQNGLGFCVITDHGGPAHEKVVTSRAYAELVEARRACPEIIVFAGLEWNIPAAEHGSIIIPPTEDEARLIALFESRFDSKSRKTPPLGEADAIAGVSFLQSLPHKPLLFANHPARRGLDSPHELRAWRDAGPDVMRGFEGAPGHAAAPLVGERRGHYSDKPSAGSFADYPLDSYRTHGGYDYYTAQVGGLWDALLSEGRPFYITCNSDSHLYLGDVQKFDRRNYKTTGVVTATGESRSYGPSDERGDTDYAPGIYTETKVFADRRDPLSVLSGMRSGNMYTCLGGMIDALRCYVHDGVHTAPMGGYLHIPSPGATVELVVEIEVASRRNLGGIMPSLDHVDLIVGDIVPGANTGDSFRNPTARVLRRIEAKACRRSGNRFSFRHVFTDCRRSFYLRLRGTNTPVVAPQIDPPDIDPWTDLWFYGNPIFVMVKR